MFCPHCGREIKDDEAIYCSLCGAQLKIRATSSVEPRIRPIDRSKYKRLILASFAIVIVVVILFVPFIPVQYTTAKTRTVNLQYHAEVYGINVGLWIPKIVNVTNKDSIGGTFSITMKMWRNNPLGQPRLLDTSTDSSFINAGDTHTFPLPDDWIINPVYFDSLTYSVSAPSKQENYNVTNTEYKSILNLIAESLRK